MAIAKVVYKESSTATPSTWMDVTQKTVTSATMLSSITALKNDGTNITGTIATKSVGNLWFSSSTATFGVPAGYYSGTGAIYWTIASKGAETFVPAETAQTISSYQWLTGSQTIAAISSTYVGSGVPTVGAATIYPSTSAQVAVSSGTYTTGDITVGAVALQSKTVTPTESAQTVTPDSGSVVNGLYIYDNDITTTGVTFPVDLSSLSVGDMVKITGTLNMGGGQTKYNETDITHTFEWTGNSYTYTATGTQSAYGDYVFTITSSSIKITTPTRNITVNAKVLTDSLFVGTPYYNGNYIGIAKVTEFIGLSSVLVNGISSTYVGTGVPTGSISFTASTGQFRANAGFYAGASIYTPPAKATATIYPSTAQQTIASEQYLTGTQTFAPVTTLNLEASYILSGITVKIGDSANASRIANVTGTLQAESFAPIYKSLAYRSTIYSSHPLVSEWANSLSNVSAFQFAGQFFYGNMTFENVQSIDLYGFGFPTATTTTRVADANMYFPNCTYMASGAFVANTNVKYIEAPLVSIIESAAFSKAEIVSVSFENCSSIRPYAFQSCAYLSGSVYFPNVEDIGSSAFAFCSIKSANFPKCSIIWGAAFSSCRSITTAIFPSCTYIHYQAFSYCSKLTTISFPKCEYISYYAFYSCGSLSEAIFPECSVISGAAFYSCSHLTTISFPKCKIITNSAFIYCSQLESAIFPKCEYIYYSAFAGCSSLSVASFPSCSYVERGAFYGCTTLANINLETCEFISSHVFYGCSTLSSIDLPSCKTIAYGAFTWCTNIASMSLPVCETIYSYAFASCSQLQEISLPSLKSIQGYAFASCIALESVYLMGSSIPTFSTNVFAQTPIQISTYLGRFGSIYVPSSLVDSYKTATNFTTYSSRIVGI